MSVAYITIEFTDETREVKAFVSGDENGKAYDIACRIMQEHMKLPDVIAGEAYVRETH